MYEQYKILKCKVLKCCWVKTLYLQLLGIFMKKKTRRERGNGVYLMLKVKSYKITSNYSY